jgi:hypothetical protein
MNQSSLAFQVRKKTIYLARPSLGQIADDDDLLGSCKRSNHFTDLKDELLGECSFVVSIVLEFPKTRGFQ